MGYLSIVSLAYHPLEKHVSIDSYHQRRSLPILANVGIDLTIGQDMKSIEKYHQALKVLPHGVMSYASLSNLANTSTALYTPIDYGSGIQWATGLTDEFPDAILQLGLWIVGMCKDIADGTMDAHIDALATYLNQLNNDVLLRIGYEFDSPQNNYEPQEYIGAYRYIVNRLRAHGVTNTGYVWHASGFPPRRPWRLSDWFPGKDFVDWCGVSLFQQPYDCHVLKECKLPHAERVVSMCKGMLGLPVMVAESTPFGGIIDELDSDKGPNRAGYTGSSWSTWFIPVISFIEAHDIQMWSYINCHWDAQPQWRRERAPGIHWGDSRVQCYPGIQRRWIEQVLRNKRYSWKVNKTATAQVVRGVKHTKKRDGSTLAQSLLCVTEDIYMGIEPYQWHTLIFGVLIVLLFSCGVVWIFRREFQSSVTHDYVTIP